MSSKYVRDTITSWISTNIPGEDNVVDITGQFEQLQSFLSKNGITGRDRWMGLQFVGSEEVPITVTSNNTQGCYREFGSIFLHIVEVVNTNATVDIITRSENVRNKFRGQRIDDILITGVTPPNFESSATLNFNGGYTSAAVILNYYRDLNL